MQLLTKEIDNSAHVVDKRAIEKLRRDLGPLILGALEDPDVIEIMLNSNGTLWTEANGVMKKIGVINKSQAESILRMIASLMHVIVDEKNPILECELPFEGSRFEGLLPPSVENPTFAIRKKAVKIYTLDDYVKSGTLTAHQKELIEQAVKSRLNILAVGGTSSGKTTFVNAIIDCIEQLTPEHRLIIIEDTNEIQCKGENTVIMRTNIHFSMLNALKVTMRLRPDRILVGEVRGGEALTMLKSWNTGHNGGVVTLHANSAKAGLIRLEQLIGEVSTTPMPHLIGEAVDMIVYIAKDDSKAGRSIREMCSVKYENNEYVLESIQ